MNKYRSKLVAVGILPPPYHGQAVATELLFSSSLPFWKEAFKINMEFSDDIAAVGKFQFSKIFRLIAIIYKIIRVSFHKDYGDYLYYTPGSTNISSLFRDSLILLLTKPFYNKTVVHFHSGGFADGVDALPSPFRLLVKSCFGKIETVIELYEDGNGPGAYLNAMKTDVVPNGVVVSEGADKLALSRSEREFQTTTTIKLLFIASLHESKGLTVALKSLREVLDKGHDVHLDVVGAWYNGYEHTFQAILEELDLESHVTYHGVNSGEEKWAIFKGCDILLFPTYYESENLPLVIMEAFGMSMPVISTNWRGIPHIVCKETGILAEPRDVSGITHAVCELCNNTDKILSMSKAASEKYRDHFHPEKFQLNVANVILNE